MAENKKFAIFKLFLKWLKNGYGNINILIKSIRKNDALVYPILFSNYIFYSQ